MTMKLSLIVAMDKNRAIGRGNDLPWHIPEDLKYFKTVTTGKPVIMGRKTFESILARIGKPLPNRPNYVVSSKTIGRDDITCCPSVAAAIEKAQSDHPDKEIMIIGGASIYDQSANLVDRLYLTLVETRIKGADAWFPDCDWSAWNVTKWETSSNEDSTYHFVTLDKGTPSAENTLRLQEFFASTD